METRGRWRPWDIPIWISNGHSRAMVPMGNPGPDLDCSHGDPRAMVPMGKPFHGRSWPGSKEETHVKSRKGKLEISPLFLPRKSGRQRSSVIR